MPAHRVPPSPAVDHAPLLVEERRRLICELMRVASVEQLDMLITDTGADAAVVDDLRQRGIDVLTV
ncbi:hypothetical protein [Burkholderia lata]|uniref:hypothetical protein n=1 Tax=Burkholderia lata (strain ATCC 17760 / DSM 23089 / LMG 22485 / NCIMB 9086 / R18194 / 383) TaxID=482957 RepID=UPI00399C0FFC